MAKPKIIIGTKLILIIGLITIFLISMNSCVGAISEERDVSGFDKVTLSGSGDLIIEQGDTESLTIEAQANTMQYIETKVSGGTLSIGIPDKAGRPLLLGSVKYYLTVKDLSGITALGSGNIISSDLVTDTIGIIIGGSGAITLSGEANTQEIEINGSGKYSAKNFKTSECIVKINGSGSANVNVSDNLDITINGSGDVKYTGDPSVQKKQN
jgi:hypothetical protein